MAKATYMYWQKRFNRENPDQDLEEKIQKIQEKNKNYVYRRIFGELRKQGLVVNKKKVQRIMKKLGLQVTSFTRKSRKYNSYKGEISPEVDNVINRDFSASQPNQKWLTDITEFHIPAGKVYLSPIIDCFDGMVVSWTIGTSPNAELVNTMLQDAINTLKISERPMVHSDRGCHYR